MKPQSGDSQQEHREASALASDNLTEREKFEKRLFWNLKHWLNCNNVDTHLNAADFVLADRILNHRPGLHHQSIRELIASALPEALEHVKAPQWQPIETAPKISMFENINGDVVRNPGILTYWPTLEIWDKAWWDRTYKCWTLAWDHETAELYDDNQPTHWMPLEAPQDSAKPNLMPNDQADQRNAPEAK